MSAENLPAVSIGEPATGDGASLAGASPSESFEAWLAEATDGVTHWPRTDADVEKALEWMGEAEEEIEAVEARLKAHIEAVTARAAEITQRQERRLNGLRMRLEQYAVAHRESIVRGKVKSKVYLTGSIGFRATQERLEVTDKKALVAWLETLPPGTSLVRTKVEPELKAIQAHFKATGEIPPGCDVKPAGESIHIEPVTLPSLEAPKSKALKENA